MKQALFLRVFKNNQMLSVRQFNQEQIVIGNGADVDLSIDDALISPIHAMIEVRGENYYLCDLGSASGTIKNGNKVLDEEIVTGDEIFLGDHKVEFHVGIPKPKSKPVSENTAVTSVTAVTPKPAPTPAPTPVQAPTPAAVVAIPEVPKPESPKPEIQKPEVKKTEIKKPEVAISAGGLETVNTGKTHGTFAPPGQVKDLYEVIRPGKGAMVEVSVAWGDRIINTHHFEGNRTVTVGSHPKNDIVLPVFQSTRASHTLLKMDAGVTLFISSDMSGEVFRDGQVTTFSSLIGQNKMARAGSGYTMSVEQGAVAKVQVAENIQLFIRFGAQTAKPAAAPFMFMTSTDFTAIIVSAMVTVVMGVYVMIYAPQPQPEEKPVEAQRIAKFEYEKPKQPAIRPEEEKKPEPVKEPQKIPDAKKTKSAEKQSRDAFEEAGAAQKAAPNKSKSKEVKLTTPNAGQDKGISKAQVNDKNKPDSGAASKKDVSKSGLFSAFGTKGTQDLLNKVYAGSGVVGGLSKNASGTGGQSAAGSGIIPGSGLKSVGAGDTGTATVGIAGGVATKGRGGGIEGYGSGSIGGKKGSTVIPGGAEESFQGTIDKDAVRRVIQANRNVIRACYERVLNRLPDLEGKVILEWEIGPGGAVLSASVKNTSLNNSEVEQCLVSRLKTWRFPEPPKDSTAQVVFPFVFRAQ